MTGAVKRAQPRVLKGSYYPFPELEITGDGHGIYAWLEAAHEFEYGHPQPLADMLTVASRKTNENQPPAFVLKLLADSITAKLKIQRKGQSNRKLSLSDRMRVRFHYGIQKPRAKDGTLKSVQDIAAEERKEPIEIRQRLANADRDFEGAWAARLAVSVRTIRSIIKPSAPKRK